jgi:DNA-binding MarR family transcriptional regulator
MEASAPRRGPHHAGGEIHLLRAILQTHHAIMNAFSRQVGIPASRLGMVRMIAVSYPDGIGVMDIARQLGINPAAVTRQVAELEQEGLVARKAVPGDKRRATLRLTPKGLRLFEQVHERAHAFERALAEGSSEADLAAALSVLDRVRSAAWKLG